MSQPAIKPGIESIYPLSVLQQGVLFHVLYETDTYYFQQWELELCGALDVALLHAAWSRVIERHPALRTSFVWDRAGEPLQVVFDAVVLPWVELDWSELEAAERERQWSAFVRDDRERGFDLSRAPLLRVAVVRTGTDEHRMLWSSHHLILDGWSHWLVFDELFRIYAGLREGTEPDLSPARGYGDYIRFVRAQNRDAEEPFWRKALQGVRDPTRFPSEPSADAAERNYGIEWLDLGEAETRSLDSAARRLRVTQNTIVQGAWAILCSRYSGSPDVVFGVTVSGRSPSLEGVEGIVGVLINTLPVRVRVGGEEIAAKWLAALQDHQIDVRDHQYSSLTQTQGWSEVPRGTPLFESLIIFENFPTSSAAMGIEDLKIREIGSFQRASYPLTLSAIPGESLRLRLAYDRRRFQDPAIRRMLGHLRHLVLAIVRHPEAALDDLEMIPEDERARILEWDREATAFATGSRLHETFEDQARRTPDAVALELEGATLSYGDLNRRANRLARSLGRRGVKPGDLVGICLNRSFEMVTAILAVLKAGGAYVPLDPAYPADRLRFMAEDSGMKVLLSDGASMDALPEAAGVSVCRLDDADEAVSRESPEDLHLAGSDEDLAYVIYTSGSTGHPKGVLVTHRNVDRLFGATEDWYGFGAGDVWTLFHSYAFDFSVWEIWGALRYGGRLVIVPQSVARSPEEFRELLSRSRVTVLNQTPSAFRALIAADETSLSPLFLRAVIFGGEALDATMLRPWFERRGDEVPRLVNMYGITETTVHVTYHPLSRADAAAPAASAIGRPIPDLQVLVLDPRGRVCPAGVAGELHVAGEGVARGYLHRPELTRERFLPNPFSRNPECRLYRTGDLGRYRSDGTLEYLGRLDQQVKIRGHRIELGEVEAAISGHERIAQAVVVAREDKPGDSRLIAYVVAASRAGSGSPAPSEADVRSHLKKTLPIYMIPSTFLFLESLPLTPSGKVDRRALPAPRARGGVEREGFVAPRNETERAVAAIWASVLGVEALGAGDSFFEQGGHSLLATQVVSRVRDRFHTDLPIRVLFDSPTVEEFARAVDGASGDREDEPIVRLARVSTRGNETP
ncbi:MAG: amino acid adenylation domain-containing protein [Acidobacteriota bacterium]